MLYLDNAGAAVPTKELIEVCAIELLNKTYGNPHSDPKTHDIIEKTRKNVLNFIGLNEDEYTLVFASGATEAIKFIGYNFNVKKFSYTRCNHNSITGLRNLFTNEINVLDDDFNVINFWGEEGKEGINLVAYPLESNFSGKLFPLEKVNELQNENTFVLLDCAKYITCRKLDLCKPDFIPISFYKLFGMPTGLGCLCIHKRALPFIKKDYYGGGTYSIIDPLQKDIFVPRESPFSLEDGTCNYQGIISLGIALELNTDYYTKNKAVEITKYAFKELKKLRHYNNTPLLQIYGVDDINNHGSIIAFNLMDQNGEYIGFKDVEKLCEQKEIKLRSGCVCNPGDCQFYLNLTSEEVMENYKRGNKCWDTKSTSINGKPTGAIRISFGYSSTLNDVNLFVKFLQDNYLSKEYIPFDNSTTITPRIKGLYIYPIKGALGFRVNNWVYK
jgi:molybdenum cofactor sulfurtransferase